VLPVAEVDVLHTIPVTSALNRHSFRIVIKKDVMNWIQLTDEGQLQEIVHKSSEKPQVIFKHSTRCSISSMAKGRLERSTPPQEADFYFLDLIAHRNISNKIASDFHVYHESPQVLVIKNGECVYDESHGSIDMDEIRDQVATNVN
jgi:bacillithiol system protein YtxJ